MAIELLFKVLHFDKISFKWKAFNENTLMIRKPAVELINYIKKLDLSNPAYRFILCEY
jgi:hypothetical protein